MILKQLSGLTVELIDEYIYECLSFDIACSHVSATLGEQGGALCASILTVQVSAEQELIFSGANFHLHWAKLMVQEDKLVVVRNKQLVTYKILSKLRKTKRYLP